jgi:hypothetical protein
MCSSPDGWIPLKIRDIPLSLRRPRRDSASESRDLNRPQRAHARHLARCRAWPPTGRPPPSSARPPRAARDIVWQSKSHLRLREPRWTSPPTARRWRRHCREALPEVRCPGRGDGSLDDRHRPWVTGGRSIRSTAPPTSCTACPSTHVSVGVLVDGVPTSGRGAQRPPGRASATRPPTRWRAPGDGATVGALQVSAISRPHARADRHRLPLQGPGRHLPPLSRRDDAAVMTRGTAGMRRPGAASIDLAWVAAGHFDGFWEPILSAVGRGRGHPAGARGRWRGHRLRRPAPARPRTRPSWPATRTCSPGCSRRSAERATRSSHGPPCTAAARGGARGLSLRCTPLILQAPPAHLPCPSSSASPTSPKAATLR